MSSSTRSILNGLYVLAPIWLPVTSATIGGLINSHIVTLPKSMLFYVFVALPCIAAFLVGNLFSIKLSQARNLGAVLVFSAYSVVAVFVLFIAGWWALVHLSL